jgi:hypothetical protein
MRLPISGLDVSFRLPDGRDDVAILEASGGAATSHTPDRNGEAQAAILERAVDVLSRLAEMTSDALTSETSPALTSWADLAITDFEAALLSLRRFLFGDTVLSVMRCSCSERMEMEFSITHLLREIQPRIPRHVKPCVSRTNWFELHDTRQLRDPSSNHAEKLPQAFFRLPTISDQILALRSPEPYAFLKQQCMELRLSTQRVSSSIERTMETMSPPISQPIEGVCAACGATLGAQLHVPSLVLHELRASAAGIYREVHAIAATFHWDESAILAIPQLRRQAYTETIRQAGVR